MHIKATMRHHLMAIRICQEGKKKKSIAEDVDIIEINVLSCQWGKKIGASTMKNIIDAFQIIKNRTTV